MASSGKRPRDSGDANDVDNAKASSVTSRHVPIVTPTPHALSAPKRARWRLSNGTTIYLDFKRGNRFYSHYVVEITKLSDLLALSEFYAAGNVPKSRATNIHFAGIHAIKEPVAALEALVGLADFKRQVLDIVLYFLQRLDEEREDMLHTVVYGPPGCGKTTCVNLLAQIYARLGILRVGKVHTVRRSDLIGKYVGHTAVQTRKAIEAAFGSVLLIDEAYSLGDPDQKDSFARECIDTLNQYLSEHKGDFVCILAGYEKDLRDRFFKTNPGLERRFPFKITIPAYTAKELRDIFVSVVRAGGWQVEEGAVNVEWFDENMEALEFAGGDMQTLFLNTKFVHGRRVFCAEKTEKKTLTREDIDKAMKGFLSSDKVDKIKADKERLAWLYT